MLLIILKYQLINLLYLVLFHLLFLLFLYNINFKI